MKKGDKASPNIILAGRALLMKMLITLEPYDMLGSNLYTQIFQHFPVTGMPNGDEASSSIILFSRAIFIKMVITLELRCIFCSHFCLLLYLKIVQMRVCKTVTRTHRASFWPVKLFW